MCGPMRIAQHRSRKRTRAPWPGSLRDDCPGLSIAHVCAIFCLLLGTAGAAAASPAVAAMAENPSSAAPVSVAQSVTSSASVSDLSTALSTLPDVPVTNKWGTAFMYGAWSEEIATALLGLEYPRLISRLSTTRPGPNDKLVQLRRETADYLMTYRSLTQRQLRQLLNFGAKDRSRTIYEEARSILNYNQNVEFISKMLGASPLKPVDSAIHGGDFIGTYFYQFNTHRALYNNAYRIPENSLAGVLAAYATGIRNVEFDVLENRTTASRAYPENVVVHDLVTNRGSGDYANGPHYVSSFSVADWQKLRQDIVNPLAASAQSVTSPDARLMLTSDFLYIATRLFPEMIFYADARNDSPVSLFRILLSPSADILPDRIVTKIYPFTLRRGAKDIIETYATRYENGDSARAFTALDRLRAPILAAMGSTPEQVSEQAGYSDLSDFSWDNFKRVTDRLPFSANSSATANLWDGQPIFSPDQIADIEARSWLTFRWATDLNAIGNVLVYQQNTTPSLLYLVRNPTTDSRLDYTAMSMSEKVNSAIIDNFNKLYDEVNENRISVKIKRHNGSTTELSHLLALSVHGMSDRYPDYTLQGGSVTAPIIKDYLYSMTGTSYQKDDFASKTMKSSRYILKRMNQLIWAGLTPRYITTDLPTDLRAAFMRKDSTTPSSLPLDQLVHANGLVKQRYLPADLAHYQIPDWSKTTFGNAKAKFPNDFDTDYARVVAAVGAATKAGVTFASLDAASHNQGLIVDTGALQILGKTKPVLAADIPSFELDDAVLTADYNRTVADATASSVKAAFQQKYGYPFERELDPHYD